STGKACRDVLLQVRVRNGDERWLLVSAEPLRDPAGELSAVVSSFRDVTERKRVQIELRAYQERLETMVAERTQALTAEVQARRQAEYFSRLVADIVPGRIAYWDRDVRCLFVNKTYCAWFNEEPLQILGLTMRESRGEAYYESVRERVEAVLRGEAQDFERGERIDGELRVSRILYMPDVRENMVRGFVVLAIDITQQKQAESLLQEANEQLAEARDQARTDSRAKSAFLATMSHEIRTPMNAIIGFTYMLRREIRDPLQQQRLVKIGEASNHLLQVINDILDLS
ncbi:PAS domain-containing protein, partial [Leptospira sp. SA-E8]|uniref:PAS domain-containing protein n=1 Tax=Leptospira sp. SA-E8 TaxID=3422259 RepID=UPI003EBBBD6D